MNLNNINKKDRKRENKITMNIKQVEYQRKAIEELKYKSKMFLNDIHQNYLNEILFTSPVASGKTVMTGIYMNELVEELNQDNLTVAYLWLVTGKGKLHKQSESSLKNILNLNIKNPNEIIEQNTITNKDVVFLNWESIRQSENKFRTKNIDNKSIITAFENSKVDVIITLIDEAHESRNTLLANEFLNLIKPSLIVNITATPQNMPNFIPLNTVTVPISNVIQQGFIKKEIIVNDNITGITKNEIIKTAIEKRNTIQEKYRELNKNTIPLCLIQIENEKTTDFDLGTIDNVNSVYEMLVTNGIKESEIGVWVGDKKRCKNIDNILNSDVKYLIFKQSIATGWDCPRSHILVRFREVNSITFDIQTIGRILRTVEKVHYGDEFLDRAYIYTENECINFKEEVDSSVRNLILNQDNEAVLKNNETFNNSFKLVMEKRIQKAREDISVLDLYSNLKTDLGMYIFDLEVIEENLKLDILKGNLTVEDIKEGLENLEKENYQKTKEQIQYEYSEFMKILNKRYGLGILLPKLIKEIKGNEIENDKIKELIVSNKKELNLRIQQFLKDYLNQSVILSKELHEYKIPVSKYYSKISESKFSKYAYTKEPDLSVENTKSKSESLFADYLNNNSNVENWFKNGLGKSDFSIVYVEKDKEGNNVLKEYFPDFMIISKTKKLYILDVKSAIGKQDFEGVRLKYNAGKEFENYLKENLDSLNLPITDVEISVVKKENNELTSNFQICNSLKYEEDLNKNKWNVLDIK